jgi:pyruvate/2-oxoglutarate dehydrogenase complex dihydrolipoamide dehydrogenase (E3) component
MDVDICVIQEGFGGLSVAAVTAQIAASSVLIEKHKIGGDCLTTAAFHQKHFWHSS